MSVERNEEPLHAPFRCSPTCRAEALAKEEGEICLRIPRQMCLKFLFLNASSVTILKNGGPMKPTVNQLLEEIQKHLDKAEESTKKVLAPLAKNKLEQDQACAC